LLEKKGFELERASHPSNSDPLPCRVSAFCWSFPESLAGVATALFGYERGPIECTCKRLNKAAKTHHLTTPAAFTLARVHTYACPFPVDFAKLHYISESSFGRTDKFTQSFTKQLVPRYLSYPGRCWWAWAGRPSSD
jgi:hypothetical protein